MVEDFSEAEKINIEEKIMPLVTPNDILSKALKLLSEKRIIEDKENKINLITARIQKEGIDIRDFDDTEISEINKYVITQIPQSLLPQLFILTEEPIKKMKIFLIVFRIITGIREFVEKLETRNKLDLFMKDVKQIYDKSYSLFNKYELSQSEYIKDKLLDEILSIIDDKKHDLNKFINSFLVFAEKQELISTDSVSGVKLDTPEGVDLYEKISKMVEE